LNALALVCTLSPSPAESSSELIAQQLLGELAKHDVSGTTVRVVDYDVKPGVQLDMGDGDAWPGIWAQVIDADILIVSTPTWMG
jgi:multimeric flavodoxin WrbA